jgi:NAD(P) transhydrogenase
MVTAPCYRHATGDIGQRGARRCHKAPSTISSASEVDRRDSVRPFKPQSSASGSPSSKSIVHDVLARNDIRVVTGRAAFEDPFTPVVDSVDGRRRLTASNILIAVGTTPSKPKGVDADDRTIMTSDTVLGLKQLPRTMVVVGAGVIGIEYASMFAALGVQVTVIDQRPRPLEFLDHEIIDELIHQMRKSDIVFRCGDAVQQIEVVGLASGKHLVGDVVLFSAGRIGAPADLNLAVAGLTADERGRLQVDDRYRTGVSHVWAAGDVIGFPRLLRRRASRDGWQRASCSASTRSRWAPIFRWASTPSPKCR